MILERPSIRVLALFVLGVALSSLHTQGRQPSAPELLHHALYLADLYNWAAAGPEFAETEKMFAAAGDQRNALYARLGKIRSNLEPRNLPATSAQLATELETNSFLQ